MIRIISGEPNSGKSRRFLDLYEAEGSGDTALYARKLLDAAGMTVGYRLMLLPGGGEIPFAMLRGIIPPDSYADYEFQGRFAFSREAFAAATHYVLSRPSPRVWIDEVGNLELKGLGYDSLLRTLLCQHIDLVITARISLAERIRERYSACHS